MNSILIVMMLVNGVPQGRPMEFEVTDASCRTEVAMIAGINRTKETSGIRYEASCGSRVIING